MENFAIAIPCLNSALTLAQTLESITQTEHFKGSTIVLLDGGSTDFTRQIYEYFASQVENIRFIFREFPGVHPAERLNTFIQEGDFEFISLCHSDDIYISSAMFDMLMYLKQSNLWAVGSQNGCFQHPADAAFNGSLPYIDNHSTHPESPDQIYCEMPFWWAIGWNTVLLRAKDIASAQIRLDPIQYQFCNDYRFNWELAKLGKIANVPYFTVLTRHRQKGDGPQNVESLAQEVVRIKELILEEIGLKKFLGNHFTNVLKSISYSYGRWDTSRLSYPRSHYLLLASKLMSFSQNSSRLTHFEHIGKELEKSLLA